MIRFPFLGQPTQPGQTDDGRAYAGGSPTFNEAGGFQTGGGDPMPGATMPGADTLGGGVQGPQFQMPQGMRGGFGTDTQGAFQMPSWAQQAPQMPQGGMGYGGQHPMGALMQMFGRMGRQGGMGMGPGMGARPMGSGWIGGGMRQPPMANQDFLQRGARPMVDAPMPADQGQSLANLSRQPRQMWGND